MFLLPAQTTQKYEKCVRNIWRTSRKRLRHALWTFLLLDVVYICYSYSYMCAFSLSCVTCPDYYITHNNACFACLLFLSQLSPRVWVARVDSVTGPFGWHWTRRVSWLRVCHRGVCVFTRMERLEFSAASGECSVYTTYYAIYQRNRWGRSSGSPLR